jgi:DNA polymerase III subunit alpha
MSHAPFVHLHNHSEYSLLNALARLTDDKGNPSDLLKQVAAWKMPALALTDSGNMYGAVEFYSACTEVGVNPILGTEAYMAPTSRLERKGAPSEAATPLVLLAENEAGYKNIMKLATRAFLEGMYYKPRIDREILKEHASGVIALSGPIKAEIPTALIHGDMDKALSLVEQYKSILGPRNFFIELWDHGLPAEKKVLPLLLDLAKKTGTPVVATNDCYYFRKEDAVAHDILLCIGMGKTVDDAARPRFPAPEYYYKSPEEMVALFKDVPEAVQNTLAIAERCRVTLRFDQILLPRYEVPVGDTPDSYLEKLCLEGLKNRFGRITPDYKTRLDSELDVIRKMGFSTYFLIVWDFIHHAKKNGIPVGPGRGSGAGALTAYGLGITNIDPIVNGLLFERFLNPERRSMPDLDIDFADDGREEVIQYVRRKYGETCVAQIITFGAMLARLVVRDVGRALGMPLPDVDKIARLIPKELGITIHQALEAVPELKEAAAKDPQIKKLFELSKKLEGVKRHTGVHAAGTIIASGEITDHVPLARGSRDVVTTQYNDENSLKLGLLKVDFLGLRTLRIIRDAVNFVKKRHKPDFDIEKIPLDDAVTYKLLSSGKTAAVFQVESGGMRDLLRKLRPSNIDDVVALISLYRPGPMGSGMLDEFVGRKHGKIKVKYDHPILEPILKDTYGVIVYQEQVMRISQSMAGYTQGESDSLRKAMGKKIPEIIEKQRGKFVDGSLKNGVEKKIAEKIFDLMVQFGGYGFNKSHASAYGLVSYQTAYLKANFPVEFMAAVLTSEIGHSNLGSKEVESKMVTYINDAQEIGLAVEGPEVNASQAVFDVESDPSDKANPVIRFGLTAVKNVGEGAVESLLAARREGGPFKGLDDFCARVDTRQVNRKVLESLVKGGAFDGFRPALEHEPEEVRLAELRRWRAQLFDQIGDAMSRAVSSKEESSSGQSALFDLGDVVGAKKAGGLAAVAASPSSDQASEWSEHELLANEKEVLGFYISGHPLARYRKEIKAYTSHTLENLPENSFVRVAGMIVNVKKVVTKNGQAMCRFKLEDLDGEVECVVFPKMYTPEVSKAIAVHEMVVLKAKVEPRDDGKNLLVEEISSLKDARDRYVKSVVLCLSTTGLEEDLLARIDKAVQAHPGRCALAFRLKTPAHGDYGLVTQKRVAPTDALLHDVEKILGPGSWELKA